MCAVKKTAKQLFCMFLPFLLLTTTSDSDSTFENGDQHAGSTDYQDK